MKFKLLILSSMLSVGFLAVMALCANWDSEKSLSADELIAGGEEAVYVNPAGFPTTPIISREHQTNKSTLDWTIPSTLAGGGKTAKESRTQAESASSETANDTALNENASAVGTIATMDTELPPAQPTVTAVGGSWIFTLKDRTQKDLALSLFKNQTGNDVFGSGKIKEGNSTLDVTVSGTVTYATLDLNINTVGTFSLYKLKLNLSEDRATGEYNATSASGESWTGSAEGQKTS